MFAVLACVLIALSAFGVHPEDVDLFQLGVAALALQFAWPTLLPPTSRGVRS